MNLIDHEAERRILSGMLNNENACLEAISALSSEDFSEPLHKDVFDIIVSIYTRNIKPTYVELLQECHKLGLATAPKDFDQLHHIEQSYIEGDNSQYWINEVKTKANLRRLNNLVKKYSEQLKTGKDGEAQELIENASTDFSSLSIESESEEVIEPAEFSTYALDLITKKMEQYRQKVNSTDECILLEGVPTGLESLDSLTLGYKPGDLIILGAQTGHGKTAFALQTSEAIAIQSQNPLLYINTEMSKNQLALRWGAILSGVKHDRVRSGGISNEEYSLLMNAFGNKFYNGKFYLSNMPNLTISKLINVSRKVKIRKNIEMIILDYVGRMEKFNREMQEWQLLEQTVKTMKQLAQNLECACMVLVQLNSDGSMQGAKRMENESDVFMRLAPVEKKEADELQREGNLLYDQFNYRLNIKKNRDGRAGIDIPLFFDKETQQIRQSVKITK